MDVPPRAERDHIFQRVKFDRATVVHVAIEIVVNFVAPYAIFSYAQPHVGDVRALMASSIPPIVWSIIEVVRKRRLDAVSLLVIAGIALGLIAFAGGGGVKFLQLRENLVNALIGLVFIGSAIVRRPLIYELARATMSRRSAEKRSEFEGLQIHAGFRHAMYVMTWVWGFGLLAQTAVLCALVFAMPIKSYLLVSPVVANVWFGALALWNVLYVRQRRRARSLVSDAPPTGTNAA